MRADKPQQPRSPGLTPADRHRRQVHLLRNGQGRDRFGQGVAADQLEDDQALVLRGRSPQCAFWNLCLWNPFLHTYNYDYERVTINGAQVHYEADGSWVIVISPTDPGHPNWVSTAVNSAGSPIFCSSLAGSCVVESI